jgi:hypothetical protein
VIESIAAGAHRETPVDTLAQRIPSKFERFASSASGTQSPRRAKQAAIAFRSVSGAFGLLREAATSMPSKNRDSLDSVYIELEYREACSKTSAHHLPAPKPAAAPSSFYSAVAELSQPSTGARGILKVGLNKGGMS